jgi:RND family efflux transporter MFP subunit
MKSIGSKILLLLFLTALAGVGWMIHLRLQETGAPARRGGGERIAPVAAAPVEHGPIALRRTFSGALEASARFTVAPKVGGRVLRLNADVSDSVARGAVVAELDNDEYRQSVAAAAADLAVARANRTEAENALTIAARELQRVRTLRERGVASDSQLDAARAEHLAREAALAVAKAEVSRSEAALETARIRLGYTRVTADWPGEDAERIVAERHVDEGETVSANAPLITIVALTPISGVIFVTERDYGRLEIGQPVSLATDAWPGETFSGHIDRIAPIFRQETRQARVELSAENADGRLKPGMFIRATVELDRNPDATIVPDAALAIREGQTGVFVVNEAESTVTWRPATPGIREGDRVAVSGAGISGRVVTLGQQLVEDGARIRIPDDEADPVPAPEAAAP